MTNTSPKTPARDQDDTSYIVSATLHRAQETLD